MKYDDASHFNQEQRLNSPPADFIYRSDSKTPTKDLGASLLLVDDEPQSAERTNRESISHKSS